MLRRRQGSERDVLTLCSAWRQDKWRSIDIIHDLFHVYNHPFYNQAQALMLERPSLLSCGCETKHNCSIHLYNVCSIHRYFMTRFIIRKYLWIQVDKGLEWFFFFKWGVVKGSQLMKRLFSSWISYKIYIEDMSAHWQHDLFTVSLRSVRLETLS